MKTKKLFLVDDDRIFKIAATLLINKTNPEYHITTFENGLNAYNRLINMVNNLETLPQILLLDINMPMMNGWELLEELKTNVSLQLLQNIEIYMLTSSISDEDINLAKTYEFVKDYISKPLTKENLEKITANK